VDTAKLNPQLSLTFLATTLAAAIDTSTSFLNNASKERHDTSGLCFIYYLMWVLALGSIFYVSPVERNV
jgi:hypothetical protein